MKTQIRGNTQIIAATVTDAEIAAAAAIATTKLADGVKFLQRDGSVALTSSLPAGGFQITGLGATTNATDAATKSYVDGVAQGLDPKGSVRAATTANITLSGTQTIDGVTLSANDRVLVKDQSTGANNGIYTVAAGAWPRAVDADVSAEVSAGMSTFVSEGTVNLNSTWILTTPDPITLGSTALVFAKFSGAGQLTAGTGLSKTGDTLSIDSTVATLTGTQTLTNKSIAATQLTGALPAANFPALTGDVTTTAGALAATIAASSVTLAKMANLAANSVIGNPTGGAATPTAVTMSSIAAADTIALRDANANLRANNAVTGLTTTVTAAGTTTLTVGSAETQQFTGASTQTVVLPNATTLSIGHSYTITNRSSGAVTVNANGGGALQVINAGNQATFTAVTVGTSAGTWDVAYSLSAAGGSGTVTSASVVTANGFAGTVATATTTPAITLTTSITGVLKGNGTAISAATVGTDYVNNASFVFHEVPSGLINGSNTTFTLADTPTAGTLQLFQNGILQDSGAGNDFTLAGATITYLTAPATGDKLKAHYMK